MWGIALWGFSHALANGHAAALALFGGMAALAVAGALHIDFRKRETLGDTWLDFEKQTSFIPLAAIAAGRIRMEKGEIFWWQTLLAVAVYVGLLKVHGELGREIFPIWF